MLVKIFVLLYVSEPQLFLSYLPVVYFIIQRRGEVKIDHATQRNNNLEFSQRNIYFLCFGTQFYFGFIKCNLGLDLAFLAMGSRVYVVLRRQKMSESIEPHGLCKFCAKEGHCDRESALQIMIFCPEFKSKDKRLNWMEKKE